MADEKISDIIAEARGVFEELRKHGYESVSLDRMESTIGRIEAAYTREIGELKGERKGILKANESFAADNTRLRGELAAKDEEIARLEAYIAENDINGDTAVACLTEIKEAVDEKMAEIERLRALVKELTDALTTCMRDELDGCATRSEREEVNKHRKEYRELVSKAMEEVKDGE